MTLACDWALNITNQSPKNPAHSLQAIHQCLQGQQVFALLHPKQPGADDIGDMHLVVLVLLQVVQGGRSVAHSGANHILWKTGIGGLFCVHHLEQHTAFIKNIKKEEREKQSLNQLIFKMGGEKTFPFSVSDTLSIPQHSCGSL